MDKPKVSVVVPVYNSEKYLQKCIESLLNQTLQDIEIIVVNDGSTDSSVSILQRYCHQYPSKIVYLSQKNQGQSVARNRGVEICRGEYIGFLDSDDEATPLMFESMYNQAKKEHADLAVCNYVYATSKKMKQVNITGSISQHSLLIDCFVDPWNKLYKAEILKSNHIIFPVGYYYEDTAWFAYTVPYIKKLAYINDCLIIHYKREGSAMNFIDSKRVEHIFPVMASVLSFYQEKGFYEQYRNQLEYFYSKILLCSSMRRISKINDKTIRKQLIRKTFQLLNQYFPDYKTNEFYQKRKIGLYMRFLNKNNCFIVIKILRIMNYFDS